mgnify:CR=1 FL=1
MILALDSQDALALGLAVLAIIHLVIVLIFPERL